MSTDAITTRTVEHTSGAWVLVVSGEVDLLTSVQLSSAVDDLLARRPAVLVVDLSAVTFFGSAGLQILCSTAESFSAAGRFAVVADGPATSRPIQLTKLDEVFAVYPTLRHALVALGLSGPSSTGPTP